MKNQLISILLGVIVACCVGGYLVYPQIKNIIYLHKKNINISSNKKNKIVILKLKKYIINNSMWVGKYHLGIPEKTAEEIITACFNTKHPLLYLAIINVESHFNPYDISGKSAVGLGQIHLPSHLKDLLDKKIINKPSDLFVPKMNIKAMDYIFSKYYNKNNKNIKMTLSSYFGKEQRSYIGKVYDALGKITALVEGDLKI